MRFLSPPKHSDCCWDPSGLSSSGFRDVSPREYSGRVRSWPHTSINAEVNMWSCTSTVLAGLLWTTDQPVAETSTWQHATLTRDRNPCSRRTQTHALARTATGIGLLIIIKWWNVRSIKRDELNIYQPRWHKFCGESRQETGVDKWVDFYCSKRVTQQSNYVVSLWSSYKWDYSVLLFRQKTVRKK
jgi:hypothetical protein